MSKTAESLVPLSLARAAVEAYVRGRDIISTPAALPARLLERAGTFVSIKNLRGELRGCIGTIEPVHKTVAQEIIRNAIKAATEDYRFSPVYEYELGELRYSVDILTPMEIVSDLSAHDPKIYGLMIETAAGRRGVLLPDLEGIDTAEIQLDALRRKIGLCSDVPLKMSRFRVERFGHK